MNIDLAVDVLQVWWLELEGSGQAVSICSSMLDADEFRRATQFRFEQHRREFIIARGILKLLLARYLGEQPHTIGFAYGERGKPRLAIPATDLRFNLSHSAGLA